MEGRQHPVRRYASSTFDKGLHVLETLQRHVSPMTVHEIAAASGVERSAVFRLLCTLECRGYVRRSEDKRYALIPQNRRSRIGYLAATSGVSFRVELLSSLRRAIQQRGMELVAIDNQTDDLEVVKEHTQQLIDANVDLVVVFEPVEAFGHVISDMLHSSGIPMIAVENPIEGAVYFGANNFRAGRMAGHVLAEFARDTWSGEFDRLVLIGSSLSSGGVQARVAGVVVGLQDRLGAVDGSKLLHIDGRAHVEESREAMAAALRKIRRPARLLVSAFNDLCALGALEAVRAVGREHEVAIVGQNANREGREELRNPKSRLIASIAYFPERYGDGVLRLAQSILDRGQVPPAAYTAHMVLTARNIDRYYATRSG
jgi:ribose transport system substrate-binding protein